MRNLSKAVRMQKPDELFPWSRPSQMSVRNPVYEVSLFLPQPCRLTSVQFQIDCRGSAVCTNATAQISRIENAILSSFPKHCFGNSTLAGNGRGWLSLEEVRVSPECLLLKSLVPEQQFRLSPSLAFSVIVSQPAVSTVSRIGCRIVCRTVW